jgi:hypothetical protein
MLKVLSLRYGTIFKKAFADHEVFSQFASDVLGVPIEVATVHQEYRYPNAVGPVDVQYDLFGEDEKHRVIVEVQHVREDDFFDRFLHYHLVGIVEQPAGLRIGRGASRSLTLPSPSPYRLGRTVYTVVVLTTEPRDKRAHFSMAVSDMDPVTEQGSRLGVYRHRLVFLNAKVINDQTPPAARRWMELIADSLDGQIDEASYGEPMMQRVLGAIRDQELTPLELAHFIDEADWEVTQRNAASAGAREGALRHAREFLVKLCQATGLALDESDLARIQACDDVAALDGWTLRVPGAKRAADMFR